VSRAVTASAPGKLILFGEHAVVYGRPALVAAVDLRLTARLTAGEGPARPEAPVRLRVPQLGLDERTSWAEVAGYARARREGWRAWAERRRAAGGEPGPEPAAPLFPAVGPAEAGHVLKVALGEAAAALGEGTGPPLELEVTSELPVGAGFGSSAAAAVAVVGGFLAVVGVEPAAAEIRRIALEVERRQHGLPSGVDAATVLHGGLLWAERRGEGPEARLAVEPLPEAGAAACAALLAELAVFDGGPPAETTGAVVAAVRERAAAEPDRFDALWGRIEAVTRGFRALLADLGRDGAAGPGAARRAVELVRECEAALEAVGVVPAPVCEAVRAIEAAGGAAKVSGAGSLAGPGGGTLLALHPEGPDALAGPAGAAGWARRRVTLGGPGLRLEPAAAGDAP